MIISFIGHGNITPTTQLKAKIQRIILEQTAKDEKVLFYPGGYGNFDHLSYRFAICNRNQSMPYPFEPMIVMILSLIP